MIEIAREIPDVAMLLSLAPEELGAKLLFAMRKRGEDPQYKTTSGRGEMFIRSEIEAELWSTGSGAPPYPREKKADVDLALSEAWAWLEAQGLLVPAAHSNGQRGWRVLSRRARAMESQAEFADFKIARLLPKEILHPRIADRVWGAFMRGEYDGAVFQAMKAVEISVREASGLGDDLVGVKLMRPAFQPENGPLTDLKVEGGERVGRMELFAGAIASYKNPQSHRDVNLDDPLEALEIILLANHLLRIVDSRVREKRQAIP
jgi:uncharacterized protein (TIGR02391 family)